MGTPQGATISPLLANVYLHYVFDLWANQWRTRHAHGDMVIVRYADDIVVGFQHKQDAERFLDGLKERMQTFGLEMHPEKTRLIQFGRFAAQHRERQGMGKPETFGFLGFTHICGKTRSGRFLVMRHTIKKRMRAKLQEVKETLRQQMHRPLPEQDVRLRNVVRGYYAYHAVPPNASALEAFRTQVTRYWLRTLRHRSQKSRVTWERMNQIATRWLPRPKILHPWPEQRFDARTQGKSPVRQCRTPGSVRGAPGNRSPYRDRIIPQSTKTALYSTHLAFLVRAQLFKHVEGTALFKQPVARETALRNTGRVKRRLWFF